MAQQLFVGTPLQVLFDNTNRNIEDDIRKLSDDQILSTPLDILVQQLVEKSLIQVPNSNFDIQVGVPGRVHTLHIPYTGQEHMFYYMAPVPPRHSVSGGTSNFEVTIHAAGAWHTAESITQRFKQDLETLEDALKRLRENAERYNSALPTFIRPRLDTRHRIAQQTRQPTA